MATVDLDWSALDEGLATTLVDLLNKHLTTAKRPSFLGPVTVLGFDFGTSCPEVEVVDIQDIYPDFLEDDEDAEEAHEATPGRDYEPWSDPIDPAGKSSSTPCAILPHADLPHT